MSKHKFKKLFKWEFWHFGWFYIPIYFYWFYLSLRARSLAFFTLANPGIRFGGFVDYSKIKLLEQFPKQYIPNTIFFPEITDSSQVLNQMLVQRVQFPVILKPDVGERGWKVEKINNEQEIVDYIKQYNRNIILQEYIAFPLELGILYYRFPGQYGGKISSIVQKEFLSVVGDGKSTLNELFENSERTLYHLKMLKSQYQDQLQKVLPLNEKKVLVEIGNHSRGTTFLNANHLMDERLEKIFDEITKDIKGFYFGRFDLRTPSYEELLKGNFRVLELNGVNSEPAHIYDPHYKLTQAYRDLFKHWKTIYEISQSNHRRGHEFPSTLDLIKQVYRHLKSKQKQKQEQETQQIAFN